MVGPGLAVVGVPGLADTLAAGSGDWGLGREGLGVGVLAVDEEVLRKRGYGFR